MDIGSDLVLAARRAETLAGSWPTIAEGCGAQRRRIPARRSNPFRFCFLPAPFINTADPDAENQFNLAEPALVAGLLEIKSEIEKDTALVVRLKKKYSIKTT